MNKPWTIRWTTWGDPVSRYGSRVKGRPPRLTRCYNTERWSTYHQAKRFKTEDEAHAHIEKLRENYEAEAVNQLEVTKVWWVELGGSIHFRQPRVQPVDPLVFEMLG